MLRNEQAALDEVLDLVNDWQQDGRNGHCMPVLRGKILEGLEALADERRRDNCNWCHSSGEIDDMQCVHCKPLAGT
jgi:hypothetical protein